MRVGKFSLVIGMITILAGCVSVKPPAITSSTTFDYLSSAKRQKQLSHVQSFVANGAFSIIEAGKRPVLANYQWTQNNKRSYRISVASSLNLFHVVIIGQPRLVTLWKGSQASISAPTPEALIEREMGWTLPVRDLFYWIRGIAAPGQKQWTPDGYGHLATLTQDGWVIQFSHYTRVGAYDVPQKIVLHRPQVALTVVVKHWVLR